MRESSKVISLPYRLEQLRGGLREMVDPVGKGQRLSNVCILQVCTLERSNGNQLFSTERFGRRIGQFRGGWLPTPDLPDTQ